MDLAQVLTDYREAIMKKWSHALHKKSGERYGARPIKELIHLTSLATDANYNAMVFNDFAKLDHFLERTAILRFESGFTLSEVQKAFEVYRMIVVPVLVKHLKGTGLTRSLNKLDRCLTHTITRFSDYFQSLHEKAVTDYAQNLELEVAARTGELRESEAKYRILVEDINDGYFVNQNGIIIFANRAFCDMHGYGVNKVLGRAYLDFVAPESLNKVRSFWEKRLHSEDMPEQYIYFRLHKDGTSFPTENKVKLIQYEGTDAVAGICRDITERVRMAERIRESERLAHIGQLATSLAHEIRNPLSSIKMGIQILIDNVNLDGDNKKTMEISAKEITRLERILTEMLDFARPVSLVCEPLPINEIILTCLEILEPRIREKSITVKRKLPKRIPPILVDRGKMEQVVINILLNAIEAVPEDGSIQVEVKRQRGPEPLVAVDIRDNGSGVDSEDLPFIFDLFFSKKKKGTGLGLSNVKRIMEAHGGRVAGINHRKGFSVNLVIPAKEKSEWTREEYL